MKNWIPVVIYGAFLIGVGVAGYVSNPEKAKTALLSGGVFGSLSIFLGLLMARGVRWARPGIVGLTIFLSAVFGWRSWASWSAVASGEPKQTAALLITSMLVATVGLLLFLWRDRKSPA